MLIYLHFEFFFPWKMVKYFHHLCMCGRHPAKPPAGLTLLTGNVSSHGKPRGHRAHLRLACGVSQVHTHVCDTWQALRSRKQSMGTATRLTEMGNPTAAKASAVAVLQEGQDRVSQPSPCPAALPGCRSSSPPHGCAPKQGWGAGCRQTSLPAGTIPAPKPPGALQWSAVPQSILVMHLPDKHGLGVILVLIHLLMCQMATQTPEWKPGKVLSKLQLPAG